MRLQFIFPNLACGGAMNDAGAMEAVLSRGITHVIDLKGHCDLRTYRKSELSLRYNAEFLHLYFPDDRKDKPVYVWHPLVEYARAVLTISRNRLFVHCSAGNARSPSVIYAILRAVYGHSEQEAECIIEKNYREPLWARDPDFPPKKTDNVVHYKNSVEQYMLWRNEGKKIHNTKNAKREGGMKDLASYYDEEYEVIS